MNKTVATESQNFLSQFLRHIDLWRFVHLGNKNVNLFNFFRSSIKHVYSVRVSYMVSENRWKYEWHIWTTYMYILLCIIWNFRGRGLPLDPHIVAKLDISMFICNIYLCIYELELEYLFRDDNTGNYPRATPYKIIKASTTSQLQFLRGLDNFVSDGLDGIHILKRIVFRY